MVDAGILGPDDRIELLDGAIIHRAPQKSRHATAVSLAYEALRAILPENSHIRAQLPFNLDERSMPEPDIAVVPGQPRDYRDAHPARALLIVEVADSSLGYDRLRKLAAYARAGVPEYWILDPDGATLEVYRAPSATAMRNAASCKLASASTRCTRPAAPWPWRICCPERPGARPIPP
jgi:Uma2 family endonuclease